jgi:glucan phosphoethanolaminetransferase (alkaline phosphatase superfamily)
MKIKSIAHCLITIVYLGVMLVSILVIVKPGASIFYYKGAINNPDIKPDTGFAYRYALRLSPIIFRTKDILVYENGRQLTRSDGNTVISVGNSTFSLEQASGGLVYLYFATADNSSPITNGRTYTLYIPLNAFSRWMGLLYLVLLIPGFAWFLYFGLLIPENRKRLLQSPWNTIPILDQFFLDFSRVFRLKNASVKKRLINYAHNWEPIFFITILAAYLYVFMEWIFFATKPSFLSMMSLVSKIEVLLLSGLALSALSLAALLIFAFVDFLGTITGLSRFMRYLGLAIPAVILSAMVLLLLDNFTYTVFEFGIVSTSGIWRAAYALLFVLLLGVIYRHVLKLAWREPGQSQHSSLAKPYKYICLIILGISVILALTQFNYDIFSPAKSTSSQQAFGQMPNIILLSSDGLSAENMSVYGYARDTTPHLQELAQDSLVAENAFTNSGTTAPSEISLLTSKLPTTLHFGLQFEKVSSKDAYQHLPGILKAAGYKTIEYGVPTQVDSYYFNLQNSFDTSNDQTHSESSFASYLRKIGFSESAYFIDIMEGRILDRLLHIFFIRVMQNPYELVTHPSTWISDKEKVSEMLFQLDQSTQPIFFHVHLMGTHGPTYAPSIQYYSQGETQDQPGMVDFYDDTIKSFDLLVGEVIDHLQQNNEFDHTILVIYTDHDKNWTSRNRVPLIMRFPGGQYAGKITATVQNMDIAPTLLDYLGLSIPSWMDGETLLNDKLDPHRLIFSAMSIKLQTENSSGEKLSVEEQITPPFYEFIYFNIIDCQELYVLNLKTDELLSGDIPGYVNPCNEDSLLSLSQAKQAMILQLTKDGYDTSALR